MRLIDADALITDAFDLMDRNELLEDVPKIIQDYCDAQPTIDAVPVIRCRDCKWSTSKKKEGLYHCRFWYRSVKDDDYCGRAERKET